MGDMSSQLTSEALRALALAALPELGLDEIDAKSEEYSDDLSYGSSADASQGKYSRIQNDKVVIVRPRSPNYTGKLICPLPGCERTFKRKGDLKYHFTHKHPADLKKSEFSKLFRPRSISVGMPHHCPYPECRDLAGYRELHYLKDHINRIHGAKRSRSSSMQGIESNSGHSAPTTPAQSVNELEAAAKKRANQEALEDSPTMNTSVEASSSSPAEAEPEPQPPIVKKRKSSKRSHHNLGIKKIEKVPPSPLNPLPIGIPMLNAMAPQFGMHTPVLSPMFGQQFIPGQTPRYPGMVPVSRNDDYLARAQALARQSLYMPQPLPSMMLFRGVGAPLTMMGMNFPYAPMQSMSNMLGFPSNIPQMPQMMQMLPQSLSMTTTPNSSISLPSLSETAPFVYSLASPTTSSS